MVDKIHVFNPTPDRARSGLVEIRIGRNAVPLLKQPFVVKDDDETVLQSQYDVIDHDDSTRDTLVILLKKEIPPRETVTLTVHPSSYEAAYEPTVQDPRVIEEQDKRGVKLINHILDIYFSLVPDQGQGGSFYAGAATSVVMTDLRVLTDIGERRKEILDALAYDYTQHDPQKRCMQVELVQLVHPATDAEPVQTNILSHRPYEVVATSEGPLRATVTVASDTFDYLYRDPLARADAPPVTLHCKLYRALSIYRDDAVVEHVYVRGTAPRDTHRVDLHFVARFFAYMDMGRDCSPVHYREIPDWLALGCSWPPHHGYGFCTDRHATPVQSPHPEFPGPNADHTFSWSLGYSAGATCLHMFKLGIDPALLANETGKAWYHRIYQPLQGTFA